jgi:hypothetical protein
MARRTRHLEPNDIAVGIDLAIAALVLRADR